ncbi:MAG: M56 family metallopeptidase [Nonlabens sp.]
MDYLSKFSIILFSLWVFYKLLLENTSWHNFKRVYLLFSVTIAAIIPLLVVRTVVISLDNVGVQAFSEFQLVEGAAIDERFEMNWSIVLWTIYCVGALLMSIRFLRNLYELHIKPSDQVVAFPPFQLVLRKMGIVPHSFFKSIYASIDHYESGDLPEIVLKHEKAHLEQKHSLDILFIEIITIILWFNPLIYLFKYSIRLNHEFLADRAVLEQYQDTQSYQKTLLSYTANHQTRTIASTFNFPIIKKRFTIMNTRTTNTSGLLRSLALIPLLTVLIISCGQEEIVEEPVIIEVAEEPQVLSSKTIAIEADSKQGNAWVNGSEYRYERVNGNIKFYDKQGEIIDFENQGFEILEVDEIEEIIEVVEKPETLMIIDEADIKRYNELARKHSRLLKNKGRSVYLKDDTKLMQTIWKNMSPEQRRNAEPWPYTGIDGNKAGEIAPPPPPPPTPVKAKSELPPPPPPAADLIEVTELSTNLIPNAQQMAERIKDGTMVVYINGELANEKDVLEIPKQLKRTSFRTKEIDGMLYLFYENSDVSNK